MWACQYVEGQVRILKRQVRGARLARNIEYVHQARVASRRLRTALQMFEDCFAKDKCDKWRREIRRLTKRLGAARDTDVQIEFLKKFITDLPAKSKKLKPGLRRLMLRLRQRRQSIQPKVVKVLDRLDKKQVLDEIIAEINEITVRCGKQHSKIQSQFVFQKTQEHISDRLTKLFSFEHSLNDPGDGKGHHQMRIAAKHLRYTLEICNLPFEKKLDDHIKGIKQIQSLLGELHDCDVWLDDIKQFSVDEKTRMVEYLGSIRAFKRLKRGIDHFVRQIRKERKRTYEQSVQYWKQFAGQDFWNKLDAILKEHNTTVAKIGIVKEKTDAVKNP
ncbi:MAG: CHAD domain-containing protein [Sedimentisphaerales bacterium]